jgi:hypothetical protein
MLPVHLGTFYVILLALLRAAREKYDELIARYWRVISPVTDLPRFVVRWGHKQHAKNTEILYVGHDFARRMDTQR